MVATKTADELDTWYSYECAGCYREGTGTAFHVRMSGPCREPIPDALCPVCLRRCPCKGTWDADENGFSDPALPATDEDLDRLANEVSDLATRLAARSAAAIGLVKRHRDVRRRYNNKPVQP